MPMPEPFSASVPTRRDARAAPLGAGNPDKLGTEAEKSAENTKDLSRCNCSYFLRSLCSLVAIESSARGHLPEIPQREFRDTHVFAVSLKPTHNVEILGFHLSLSTLCRHDVVHAQLEDHGYADDPARRRFSAPVDDDQPGDHWVWPADDLRSHQAHDGIRQGTDRVPHWPRSVSD